MFALLPGEITLDPARMSDPKLLVLGLGTTLGIVVQAAVLLPAMRRLGFPYRPLFGWDPRLTQAGGLALWAVAYVLIGQAGYIVTTRVAADSAVGGGRRSTRTPGCCCRCPTACSASRCSPR